MCDKCKRLRLQRIAALCFNPRSNMINNNYSNLYSLLIFDELCRKVHGTIIVEFYRKEGMSRRHH